MELIIARWPDVTPDLAVAWGILGQLYWEGERCEAVAAVAASSLGLGAAYGTRMLGFIARRHTDWDRSLELFAQAGALASEAGQEGLALEIQIAR